MMIELSGVHFAHDRGLDLLVEVELAIQAGEVVAVEAPAGAGATTLVRLLLGELTARGRVAFAGRDVARLRSGSRAALRRRLGVVPQDLGLIGRDTALANVALALEVCGVPGGARAARARALLAAVGVDPDLPVERLAMAERQRVAWARAIVRSPDALLADQPTSHQDADGAGRFAELVAERAELGAACLVLTRDPHLIAAGARLGWRMLALHRRTLVDVIPASAEPPHAVEAPVESEAAAEAAPPGPLDLDFLSPALAPVAGELELVRIPDIAPAVVQPAPSANENASGPTAASSSSSLPAASTSTAGADDEIDVDLADLAIPNVVPFPRARSAGNRR